MLDYWLWDKSGMHCFIAEVTLLGFYFCTAKLKPLPEG